MERTDNGQMTPRGYLNFYYIKNLRVLVFRMDGRRDGRTDGQTDGRTDRQMDGWTDRQTDRQTDREINLGGAGWVGNLIGTSR